MKKELKMCHPKPPAIACIALEKRGFFPRFGMNFNDLLRSMNGVSAGMRQCGFAACEFAPVLPAIWRWHG
jgi:hypothetical protein